MTDGVLTDIRYALRVMRRAPMFAAGVSATIGLGLGVACSAFTLVNAYLLRPIDVAEPTALYGLTWDTAGGRRQQFTTEDIGALQGSLAPLAEITLSQPVSAMEGGLAMAGLLVGGDYFEVVRPRLILGRPLLQSDISAAAPVVVLSERTWRTRFEAEPNLGNIRVRLGQTTFDVVGVVAATAALPGQEANAFWAPVTLAGAFTTADRDEDPNGGGSAALVTVARVLPSVTGPQLRMAFQQWLDDRFPIGSDMRAVAVRANLLATRIPLNNATLTLFTLLMAAFVLVLLVACANVTNLLLARALARQPEIAVRLSLGAGRWTIMRHLAVESLILAIPAAAVGLALTAAAARLFPTLVVSTFPANVLPVDALLAPLDLDIGVLSALALGAVVSTLGVSLAPCRRLLRTQVGRASRGEASFDRGRSTLRSALIAVQVAASVLFLVGAGALILESRRIATLDPGFVYDRVLTVRVDQRIRPALLARLAMDPEVDALAVAWRPPMVAGSLPLIGVRAPATQSTTRAGFMVVSPGYFDLFDIPIVRGRIFSAQEAEGNAPVAVVSAATARQLWPGVEPIGRTLEIGAMAGAGSGRRPEHRTVQIIGVVGDATNGNLLDGRDATCLYFVTSERMPGDMSLLARGPSDSPRTSVAAALNALAPGTVFQISPLRELVGVLTWIFAAFATTAATLGAIGLLLACTGSYAMVSFLVKLRAREFGVRMALGATALQVVRGLLREQARIVGAGLIAGMALCIGLSRLFSGVVPIIPPIGVTPYAVGGSAVVLATMLATLAAASRAARSDPAHALRVE